MGKALHPKYPNVLSPIRLGPVEIPTRFFFAPHGSALSTGSKPTDDLRGLFPTDPLEVLPFPPDVPRPS